MMVTRILLAGVVLAAFVLIAAAPYARSDDLGRRGDQNALRIDPASVRGGQTVRIEARCGSDQVDLVASGALTEVRQFVRTNRREGLLESAATVRTDVRSGVFDAAFHCGRQLVSTQIAVTNQAQPPASGAPTSTMIIPVGAPETGGAPPPLDSGPDLLGLAELSGVVMIAGAGAAVTVASRRRIAAR
ncbi:hypothetical protein GCM10010174_14490 [Kutzneria viridogrisea]|uniref:Uncharacterized protein n=2 Tax=Kutzneria TaxID=43356 RepID=W5WJK3_9PSEU|nr:hypothetical protein [Kutzneria albida]AHI00926.1 hypothetical protein KALB_7568 [Kutzneria albida DSM 43870]MBA8926203.1 hypothetical protein [Kutzneria viridogrisea]